MVTEHVDDVRAIVQRAVKDLTIEQSLKNYEAVWLSKVFTLREHVRNKNIVYQQKLDKENEGKTGTDPNVSDSCLCVSSSSCVLVFAWPMYMYIAVNRI